MARVLIIGDLHCPAMLPKYPAFLRDTYDAWECDRVVAIGDIVDNCALSFHLKKPHLKDPVREYKKAKRQVKKVVDLFDGIPVDLMLGNHDVLPYRWATEVGIPEEMLAKFADVWDLPDNWTVHKRYAQHIIDDVIYQHGDRGKGGRLAASNNAKAEFKSVVQGHFHAQAGIEFTVNASARIFGLQVGCGTDWKHMAMEYGIKFTQKPVIGCGVVIEGHTPIFEPMLLGCGQ